MELNRMNFFFSGGTNGKIILEKCIFNGRIESTNKKQTLFFHFFSILEMIKSSIWNKKCVGFY